MDKLCILLLCACCSCSLLEPMLPFGQSRLLEHLYPGEDGPPTSLRTVSVSAVSFPSGYDWHRDSSFGSVCCTLKLFRNGLQVLSVAAGRDRRISPDPDMSFIIEGELYTRYSDAAGTVVTRGGRILTEFSGREYVCGLLESGDGTYTLGQLADGGGFVLRLDGKEILRQCPAVVMGDFGRIGYPATGALYMDGGQICFSYYCASSKMASVYIVRDAVSTLVQSGSIMPLDARSVGGVDVVAYNEQGITFIRSGAELSVAGDGDWLHWLDCGICSFRGRTSVAGFAQLWEYAIPFAAIGWKDDYLEEGTPDWLYLDDCSYRTVCFGTLRDEGWMMMSRKCGCLTEGDFYRALSGVDEGVPPCLVCGEDTCRFEMNGYLSGVDVQSSQ